jgi:hypothetical protein
MDRQVTCPVNIRNTTQEAGNFLLGKNSCQGSAQNAQEDHEQTMPSLGTSSGNTAFLVEARGARGRKVKLYKYHLKQLNPRFRGRFDMNQT